MFIVFYTSANGGHKKVIYEFQGNENYGSLIGQASLSDIAYLAVKHEEAVKIDRKKLVIE